MYKETGREKGAQKGSGWWLTLTQGIGTPGSGEKLCGQRHMDQNEHAEA